MTANTESDHCMECAGVEFLLGVFGDNTVCLFPLRVGALYLLRVYLQ